VRDTRLIWTFAITTIALFMTSLDNLVVTTALPVIREDLGASLPQLEWMVNAYTLTFAVLLLTGAALGDRFGRKRLFVIGLTLFTVASALAALSASADMLVLARALQGIGGAVVTPLTLTILSGAVPKEKRGMVLGAWGGIAGLAIAVGPVVGGAIVDGIAWQWIFWINVPIGLMAIPLAVRHLAESRGPSRHLDLPGLLLASGGLLGIVWGLVRANSIGWGAGEVTAGFVVGSVLLVAFVRWELRTRTPMLTLRLFRSAQFTATNVASVAMYFGMFGSIFLLTQFLQTVQGVSPFGAGLRILPWTLLTMLIAPAAGALSDRIGGRPLMASGLALQAASLAWMASVLTPSVGYSSLLGPFVIAGLGMGMFFSPVANVVLSAVRPEEEGQASGANNALRELGGVFGVAVLAAMFAHNGGSAIPYQPLPAFRESFVEALRQSVYVGAAVVGVGAVAALFIPKFRRVSVEAAVLVQPVATSGEAALAARRAA
jgi:EmrB/QacA subfamily drug resistance transporter